MRRSVKTEKQKREERDRLLFLAFLLLQQNIQKDIVLACSAYIAGTVTEHELRTGLDAVVEGAHTRAAALGRVLAQGGLETAIQPVDTQLGLSALTDQKRFLKGLADDVVSGRYNLPQATTSGTGTSTVVTGVPLVPTKFYPIAPGLVSRALLYARRLRGTAEEAWVMSLPETASFWWLLGSGVEKHCDVCPQYAERSRLHPYTRATLPTYPGAGQTPCKVNCDCRLQETGGQLCFPFELGSNFCVDSWDDLRSSGKGGNAMFSKERVTRTGKVFQVGVYPDKQFELNDHEAEAAVNAFSQPIDANIEHRPSPLDGALGGLQRIWKQGTELFGEVSIPKWMDEHLKEKGVPLQPSLEWDRATKQIKGVAWVNFPRIEDAALMSAFSVAFEAEEAKDPALFWDDSITAFGKDALGHGSNRKGTLNWQRSGGGILQDHTASTSHGVYRIGHKSGGNALYYNNEHMSDHDTVDKAKWSAELHHRAKCSADMSSEDQVYFDLSQAARDKIDSDDFAGPNRTFPINSPKHVRSAADLVGHADDPEAVKKNIIRIAKKKGWESHLPKSWCENDKADMSLFEATLNQTAGSPRKKASTNMSRFLDKARALFGLAGVEEKHTERLTDEDLAEALAELQEPAPNFSETAEFTALKTENETLKSQIAEFATKFKEQEAKAQFDKDDAEIGKLASLPFAKITPAEADEYRKLAKENPAAFAAVLPILQAKPVLAQFSDTRNTQRVGGGESGADSPGDALTRKTKERVEKTKEDYHIAFSAVCRENPDLAHSYNAMMTQGGN